jgi:hypothetical protein
MSGDASAYADLLAALLAVRSDPATSRFDAELAAAEARGSIDGPTARTLRWWQRESLRGVSDHLAEVFPDLLTHLSAAQAAAAESVAESVESWSLATGLAQEPDVAFGAGAPDVATEPSGSHLRPVDDLAEPLPLPPAPRLLRPGFSPPDPSPEGRITAPDGASRPRLLVSGLTVLTAGSVVPDVIDLTSNDATAPPHGSHPPDGPHSDL